MTRAIVAHRASFLVDCLILSLGVGGCIYGVYLFAGEWRAAYNPSYAIDLSPSALPLYSLFSALRGLAAYLISLVFTFVIGYWAANSKPAEKVILPVLDILQSIPVLGFLPGLVLGLVAIFPNSNVGLELATVIMIFTGQVWNMTFAFYASLKSVPIEMREASLVMGLSPVTRFIRLDLPYSAVNLVWNSIMSMAGGWFFLSICEAFTLGEKHFRLPGIGAYMAVAIDRGDTRAMCLGVLSMGIVIITLDSVVWRPALAWVHRFRLEDSASAAAEDKTLKFIFSNSLAVKGLRHLIIRYRRSLLADGGKRHLRFRVRLPGTSEIKGVLFLRILRWPLGLVAVIALTKAFVLLLGVFTGIPFSTWLQICEGVGLTLSRVFFCLVIGSLWAVPVGIWLARDLRRLRLAQPVTQLMASFPAPMLYPLALGLFFGIGLNFPVSSMLLMLLGVQWYILFNTLAGGANIPQDLAAAMDLAGSSQFDRWRYLYLPSAFPSLVTGWLTAAGGAWNASIVAEYLVYKGHTIQTRGLGALISQSAEKGDLSTLAACLFVMVIVVIVLNRFFWSKVYKVAQTRFRLDF